MENSREGRVEIRSGLVHVKRLPRLTIEALGRAQKEHRKRIGLIRLLVGLPILLPGYTERGKRIA